MVTLAPDQLGGCLRAWRAVGRREMRSCADERARQRHGVAPVDGMHLGRDHRARVEVHRVLGLVGQVRPAVLQLGHLCIRVGRALPIRV